MSISRQPRRPSKRKALCPIPSSQSPSRVFVAAHRELTYSPELVAFCDAVERQLGPGTTTLCSCDIPSEMRGSNDLLYEAINLCTHLVVLPWGHFIDRQSYEIWHLFQGVKTGLPRFRIVNPTDPDRYAVADEEPD